ncbi:peptidase [Burkholderia sp. AU31652]|nr:peptidase [Burkholderia sp. AU31652]
MNPCTLPMLAPGTNGELDAALTLAKAAWATCAAQVDMIAACQAGTPATRHGAHPHD